MTKTYNRFAALILTVAMTMSFLPLFGSQSAYAESQDLGDLTLDVGSGDRVRLSGTELNVVFAALAVIENREEIISGGQTYDLDKNQTIDLNVDNYTDLEIGSYSEFYMAQGNSITGYRKYEFDETDKNSMTGTAGACCSSLTIDFRKTIKEVDIQVTSPQCGTETTTPESTAPVYWEWEKQTNRPAFTIANSSEWVMMADAMWVDLSISLRPYIGKLTGGSQYDIGIVIGSNEGYKFASDPEEMSVNVNGVPGIDVYADDDVLTVFGKVGVTHNMDAGTVTQQPSVSSDGVKTYKCTGCGAVLKTEAVSNSAVKQAAYAPGQAVLKKVKKGSKKATVTLKTMKNVTGYQIQFTNTKNGSVKTETISQTKKTAKKKTVSKVVKGLAKKTKYTVQVRAFNVVNGETFYGAWSSAKSVKIK